MNQINNLGDVALHMLEVLKKNELSQIAQKIKSDTKIADAFKALREDDESHEAIMKATRESLEKIVVERKFCPDCRCHVQAEITKYDPDDPESSLIWQCLQCGNAIEFFE